MIWKNVIPLTTNNGAPELTIFIFETPGEIRLAKRDYNRQTLEWEKVYYFFIFNFLILYFKKEILYKKINIGFDIRLEEELRNNILFHK